MKVIAWVLAASMLFATSMNNGVWAAQSPETEPVSYENEQVPEADSIVSEETPTVGTELSAGPEESESMDVEEALTEEDIDVNLPLDASTDVLDDDESIATMASVNGSVSEVNVVDFGADGSDELDDARAINQALAMAAHREDKEGQLIVRIPAGTYHLERALQAYSNTSIILDAKAEMISEHEKGPILTCRHFKSDGTLCPRDISCNHAGYSQVRNVSVEGGKWDCGDTRTHETNFAFEFIHGENISLSNMELWHGTMHTVNLSGVKNATVTNVHFHDALIYTGTGARFWNGYKIGDEARYRSMESIHLDFMNEEGEPGAYPLDDTPSRDILIENCTFTNVHAGVGNHHLNNKSKSSNITVRNCTFTNLLSTAVRLFSAKDCVIENNTVVNANSLCTLNDSAGRIENNETRKIADIPVRVAEKSYAEVIGNKIHDGMHGVSVIEGSSAIIKDNTIEKVTGSAVFASTAVKCEVTNNTINATGGAAVRITDQSKAQILGNTIKEPSSHGINIGAGSVVDVLNNTIDKPKEIGISVTDSSNVNADGNTITNAGTNGFYIEKKARAALNNNKVLGAKQLGIAIRSGSFMEGNNNTINDTPTALSISGANTEAKLKESQIARTTGIAVYIGDKAKTELSGSKITEVKNVAIRVTDGANATLDKNTIVAPEKHGISVGNQSTATITNNTIEKAKEIAIVASDAAVIEAGNNTMTASTNGVYLSGKAQANLKNNTIKDMAVAAIAVRSGANLEATKNEIHNGKAGITIAESGSSAKLVDNKIKDTQDVAVYVNGAEVNLQKNTIEGAGNTAVRAIANSKATINDNVIVDAAKHGISVEQSSVNATNNTITNAGQNGVYCANANEGSVIKGNTISDSGEHGVSLRTTASTTVENNVISGSTLCGIFAKGDSASSRCDVQIKNNHVTSSGDKQNDIRISDFVTSGSISGNVIDEGGVYVSKESAPSVKASNNSVAATAVKINKESITLQQGKTEKLSATVEPSAAVQTVTWKSLNTAVATVNASGTVTAKGKGETVITATTADGKMTARCKVVVTVAEAEPTPKLVPIYRLFNRVSGEHLFTSDENEKNVLYQKYGWGYEGIAWYATPSGAGVYRLFNPKTGQHLYTTDTKEVDALTKKYKWSMDNGGKPLFYSDEKKTISIYRVYNPKLKVGSHHWTTDKNEYNALPKYNWNQEGVSFYAAKTGEPIKTTYYKK